MSDEIDIDALVDEVVGWSHSKRGAVIRAQDPEWRRKVAEANAKMHADPEWRRKIAEANAKRSQDPEWRRKQAEAGAKRSQDPEWRRKQAEAGAKRSQDPEWREAMAKLSQDPEWREAIAKRSQDPEWRRKNAEANAKRSQDPEWRRKNAEAHARRSKHVVRIEDDLVFKGARGKGGAGGSVVHVLFGRFHTAYGYHWRYATEEEKAFFWSERERTGTDGPFKLPENKEQQ